MLVWGISRYLGAFHFHVQSSAYLCPDPCLSPVSYHIPSSSFTEASVFKLIPLHSALHREHFIVLGQYLGSLVLQRGSLSQWKLTGAIKAKGSILYRVHCIVPVPSAQNKIQHIFPAMVAKYPRAGQALPQYTHLFCCLEGSYQDADLSQHLQLTYRTITPMHLFFRITSSLIPLMPHHPGEVKANVMGVHAVNDASHPSTPKKAILLFHITGSWGACHNPSFFFKNKTKQNMTNVPLLLSPYLYFHAVEWAELFICSLIRKNCLHMSECEWLQNNILHAYFPNDWLCFLKHL